MENLIKQISINDGHFKRKELEEIINRKDEAIPELLDIVQDVSKNYQKYISNEDYFGHIYAYYLLSQFRVKELYPVLIRMLKLPEEDIDYLLGSVLTEGTSRMLASVFDGDIQPIKEIIENENLYEYARGQAIRALTVLVFNDKLRREDVLDYYQSLLKQKTGFTSYVMAEIVNCCNDLYPDGVYDDIVQVYEDGLVDSFMIKLEDVKGTLAKSKEEALADSLKYGKFELIEDTIKELQNWACFYKDHEINNRKPSNRVKNNSEIKQKNPSGKQPMVNKVNIGRNDPCFCGSGKKYKKCCGN
ncbi:DUF1186 domain-containing protein [Virgibacillus necropolis]|uniref:DUF1186 domain-containing protein n=1 Tax=Virgibacillus necropolis TaxID=163877 RepID=UPI00384DDA98